MQNYKIYESSANGRVLSSPLKLKSRPVQGPNLSPEITIRLNKISICDCEKFSLFTCLEGINIEEATGVEQVWAEIKARFAEFVGRFRKSSDSGSEGKLSARSTDKSEGEDRSFPSARMTHNRMQALDGVGYRQCYMDKLREVASESEKPEASRDYWFGRDEAGPENKEPDKVKQTTSGRHRTLRDVIPSKARVTSTRLQAYVETLPKPDEEDL